MDLMSESQKHLNAAGGDAHRASQPQAPRAPLGFNVMKALGCFPAEVLRTDQRRTGRDARGGKTLSHDNFCI